MRTYLVAMLFLMIVLPALPPSAGTDGFPGGSDEAVLVLSAPRFEAYANLSVPAEFHYLNARFNVTGLAASGNDTAYPGRLSIKLGDTAIWAFEETGYGPLGRQEVFSDGTKAARARFGTGGGTAELSVRLPVGATVRSAVMNVETSPARQWKEVQNFTVIPETNYPAVAACAGDVNGDGYDDVMTGSVGDDSGGTDAGRAYLHFGGPVMNATADVVFTGTMPGDGLGWSVSGAGDVNRDGFDDVLVGAIYNDTAGNSAGQAYLYFGGRSMDSVADVVFTGEAACDYFGMSVSSAGDLNADGYDDVIIGACDNDAGLTNAGRAYIYFGGPAMDGAPDVVITGAPTDGLGDSVACAGDVNRDGYDDVIVSAPGAEAPYENTGRAHVFFGGPEMDNIPDVTFNGTGLWDQFGVDVCGAGDLNGDGYDDVAVGADDWNSSYAGRVEVFFGGREMDNRADLVVKGDGMLDCVGWSVSTGGDVNGDGYDDLLFGAEGNDSGAAAGGRAYILLGGAAMDNRWDEAFTGNKTSEYLGRPVSNAGDVNGDGFGDILFGGNWGRLYLYSRLPGTGPGPLDPGLSVGGTTVWSRTGSFNGSGGAVDIASALGGYLSSASASGKDVWGNGYVDIPLCLSARSAGELLLRDVAIVYDHTAIVADFSDALNEYLTAHEGEKDAEGNITVPLDVSSASAGRLRLSGLELVPDLPPVLVLDPGTLEMDEDTLEPALLDLWTVFEDDADPDGALAFTLLSATNSTFVPISIPDNRHLSVDALTGDQNDNWTGAVEVVVACTDSRDFTTPAPFTILVQNVNDAPVINSSPALVAPPGVTYAYNVVAAHGDSEPLTYTLTKSPADMAIDSSTGAVRWVPRARGMYQIAIRVDDGIAAVEQKFALEVLNGLPTVTSTPPLEAGVGIPYIYNITASDPNLDSLSYTLLRSPDGMQLDAGTGRLAWTPAAAGDIEVSVGVLDGVDVTYHNFTVKVSLINRPPEVVRVTGPDKETVKSSSSLRFSVEATDPDGDSLTYDWRENGQTLGTGPVLSRKFPPGNHSLVLLIGDGHHQTSRTFDFSVVPGPDQPAAPALRVDNPGLLGAAIASIAVVGLLLTASTEAGKYRWLLLFMPLYTRLHKDEVLDHGTREFIRGSVYADPGIHYNEILRKLKLARGTAAYHLHTLEREGFIRSRSDGRLRRFYPAEMKLTDLPPRLDKLQRIIVETVRESEGLGQREIARILGLPSSTVNRQINKLCDMGVLRLEREGMTTRCYPANGGNGHAADQPEPPAV